MDSNHDSVIVWPVGWGLFIIKTTMEISLPSTFVRHSQRKMNSDLKDGVAKEWADDGGGGDKATQELSRGPEARDNCRVVNMVLNRTLT